MCLRVFAELHQHSPQRNHSSPLAASLSACSHYTTSTRDHSSGKQSGTGRATPLLPLLDTSLSSLTPSLSPLRPPSPLPLPSTLPFSSSYSVFLPHRSSLSLTFCSFSLRHGVFPTRLHTERCARPLCMRFHPLFIPRLSRLLSSPLLSFPRPFSSGGGHPGDILDCENLQSSLGTDPLGPQSNGQGTPPNPRGPW